MNKIIAQIKVRESKFGMALVVESTEAIGGWVNNFNGKVMLYKIHSLQVILTRLEFRPLTSNKLRLNEIFYFRWLVYFSILNYLILFLPIGRCGCESYVISNLRSFFPLSPYAFWYSLLRSFGFKTTSVIQQMIIKGIYEESLG